MCKCIFVIISICIQIYGDKYRYSSVYLGGVTMYNCKNVKKYTCNNVYIITCVFVLINLLSPLLSVNVYM